MLTRLRAKFKIYQSFLCVVKCTFSTNTQYRNHGAGGDRGDGDHHGHGGDDTADYDVLKMLTMLKVVIKMLTMMQN